MDPFTQRMLERARARQEKIDQKLASSGQSVPKRKPLAENVGVIKNPSPIRSPSRGKESVLSPKKSIKSESPVTSTKVVTRRPSLQKSQNAVGTPQKSRNDVVVTKKEFSSPRGSVGRRNSDVSLEINITHRNDIKVDVQIEEMDAPITVVYDTQSNSDSNVVIKEIEEESSNMPLETEDSEHKTEKAGLRHNFKSRLDRLGNLYSDDPNLSSPIHRTEQTFSAATPPKQPPAPRPQDGKRKFGRLAALADQINNWEDDLTHHTYNAEPAKKNTKPENKHEKLDSSTLDVSIHSFKDINNVLKKAPVKSAQPSKSSNTRQSSKPAVNECQRLQREIVSELEPKRASTTPSAAPAPNMAAMVASAPPVAATVTKKPSLKKYRAPTPPSKQHSDDDKDKENNVIQQQENDDDASDCIQTKPEPADQKPVAEKGSPAVKRLAPKMNGNVDRSSVLSKAAMFESGSPRNKDPAEMSLRERKALFEKNKGAAIIPKAPFGMAPSAKSLHGDNKVDKPRSQTSAKTTPTKSNSSSTNNSRANSKDNLADDNISQSSLGGGIKGKLAALFSKEQTISESTIANKFKQEREKEMEMLQNRFNYKPQKETPEQHTPESDDDQSDNDPSEKAPLMGSSVNIAAAAKKPEIIANVPKVTFDDKTKEEPRDKEADKDKVVGSQPVKRRSSQDSPVVLSVLDDVKRIKVNNNKKDALTNGVIIQQPSLYPHLSDIETDTSHTQEEYSDCGGSRCGHYTLECIFFFLCI
ncbi:hypothetical protein ABMA27_008999 [Loxostege sticticalis]|uniref:Anillin N-terminal domain-containing protein n=1 Tax=Loxostege sticticalis TaxID=481309 RepID=A0ABR3H9S4_LOXSC